MSPQINRKTSLHFTCFTFLSVIFLFRRSFSSRSLLITRMSYVIQKTRFRFRLFFLVQSLYVTYPLQRKSWGQHSNEGKRGKGKNVPAMKRPKVPILARRKAVQVKCHIENKALWTIYNTNKDWKGTVIYWQMDVLVQRRVQRKLMLLARNYRLSNTF